MTAEQEVADRPMRADALKNRRRILEVAEAVFASEGVSVPIDTIAERAGVGVGTLYRHFPTKETLFEAIVMERIEDLAHAVEVYAHDEDPVEGLFDFLHEFAREAAAKRDLFDAMSSAGIDFKSQCSESIDELKRRVDVILQRAVDAGAVRSDVTTDEVIGLISGACHAVSNHDASLDRMVDVVCGGLRVAAPLENASGGA